ncbi:hypothetical protein GCM10007921_12040 [Tritonibacter mobilis]|nr:hypothetical protein GCM10007921_12040 [Tritonibacter mobilis]
MALQGQLLTPSGTSSLDQISSKEGVKPSQILAALYEIESGPVPGDLDDIP